MTLDAGTLTAIFSGLAVLLTAVSGVTARRAQQAGVTRAELRTARRYNLAADRWIFVLEQDRARRGLPELDGKPRELTGDGSDDGDAPPAAIRRG